MQKSTFRKLLKWQKYVKLRLWNPVICPWNHMLKQNVDTVITQTHDNHTRQQNDMYGSKKC